MADEIDRDRLEKPGRQTLNQHEAIHHYVVPGGPKTGEVSPAGVVYGTG
jgi:hypothetical protein